MNADRNRTIAASPLMLIVGLALAGCGGGGYDGGTPPAPTPALLSVQPASILLGQSAELTWSANAGSSCQASGGWLGAQAASGTSTVTPTTTGSVTYTLTCTGGGYASDVVESVTLAITASSLSELQASVFSARCTICHDGSQPAGGSLPGSMNLSAGNSFANLVNVASLEQNIVLRVAPGDPNASYLVHKLEGTPGIAGARMPLGGPFLDAATIAQVRSWIAAGAANN